MLQQLNSVDCNSCSGSGLSDISQSYTTNINERNQWELARPKACKLKAHLLKCVTGESKCPEVDCWERERN